MNFFLDICFFWFKIHAMKKLILNTDKIQMELDRLGKNKLWLAQELKWHRQFVSDVFKRKPITQAAKIATALKLDPKDLIISK